MNLKEAEKKKKSGFVSIMLVFIFSTKFHLFSFLLSLVPRPLPPPFPQSHLTKDTLSTTQPLPMLPRKIPACAYQIESVYLAVGGGGGKGPCKQGNRGAEIKRSSFDVFTVYCVLYTNLGTDSHSHKSQLNTPSAHSTLHSPTSPNPPIRPLVLKSSSPLPLPTRHSHPLSSR